ncbi:peptidoglycan DD-metalloendopeptidase family protein [Gammaproteobacteria bacterium]|nr:peptidoglycan DD-metalloendopeptidase family protein [Gammaproteobacteria bacterium]MDA7786308.1 peptidoglycan DD-metalloendopeptidase family protein [Gammaproteobacteria bacterium]MDA7856350.1 peptidoglycan DD-metalloendopeptidase family protein [Gammaproteobacteria bacterium]MDA9038592.1 peptidoglycan DD-metalloendopeptidase family protein [Gammaproteobacteria bacterium]MDA9044381.1 peptidoglycan DD-metalloendopeptidase family protein [Gammaproteobacteria bacterium]|tara:strand:+ start:18 stop:1274 length:1257 start_codon:yes stop_codon:yes gene_type:complete
MIGFKKVPTKLIIGIFLLLIALVLLLYLDLTSEQPPAEEEIAYSEAIEGAPLEVISQQTYEVKDGEILSIIFEKFKVPLNTQYKIYSLKEANLVTNIRPGNRIIFTYLGNELTNIAIVKDKLSSIEISIGQKIILNKVTNNIETISSYAGGTISSSFYEDASASGMPDSVIMDLAYIFGWDIDFVFDIRKGDTFSVIYETPYSKGEMVENGDILIAEFTNQNKTYVANRFIDQEGKKGYFDNNGENLQKAFLRAPLEFSYISSHFNPNRMHPVLHTIRAHNGVDYAAPRGSPVRATGSGSVEFVGVRNGCGKEIVLKHTNDYSTRYCHLNKFESKVKKGRKIQQGQVIGYVGSTGLATGPHLHYEFKIGNKHTDPVKIKLPSAEPLSSKLKMDFDILFKKNKLMLDDMRKFSSKNENG